jgi:hypothetical protein
MLLQLLCRDGFESDEKLAILGRRVSKYDKLLKNFTLINVLTAVKLFQSDLPSRLDVCNAFIVLKISLFPTDPLDSWTGQLCE